MAYCYYNAWIEIIIIISLILFILVSIRYILLNYTLKIKTKEKKNKRNIFYVLPNEEILKNLNPFTIEDQLYFENNF